MLVLTRKQGESVILVLPDGQHILLKIFEWNYNEARLGFEAPVDVDIWREEIWQRIQAAKQQKGPTDGG